MQDIAKMLQEKGYSVEPYEEIGTVKLTKKINEELVDKKQQFNCDICILNKDIEEKSIYQFDESGVRPYGHVENLLRQEMGVCA
ncbi:hypothetical protein [Bacillus cereus]|uniref:hypothetical protein n=1 Tax=Bacillus cereus TaxID=1396 RepID=UPI00397F6F43